MKNISQPIKEVVALNHDVADVNADAEPHLLIGRYSRILLGDRVLYRDSTLHGIDGTAEVGNKAIPRRIENPATMRGDQAMDDDPVSRERAEGADFIPPYQAAIALDIGREDRGELSFDGWRFQLLHLPNFEYRPTSCEIRVVLGHSEAR